MQPGKKLFYMMEMTMFTAKYSLAAVGLTVLALGTSPVRADDVTDLYFQEVMERYYEYPQNARTFAMEGSSVMTSSDSSSVVGNPAGLGMMRKGELSGSYSRNQISGDEFPTGKDVEQNSDFGSGMIAIPLGQLPDSTPEYGTLGLGWNTSFAKWDRDTFDTLSRRLQLVGSYGIAIDDTLSLGYSFGWTQEKLQSRDIFNYPSSSLMRHSLGVQWIADEDLKIGSSVFVGHGNHNALFGPGIKGDSRNLGVGFDLGAQLRIDQTILAASADYRHLNTRGEVDQSIPANIVGGDENGNVFNVRVGIEQLIGENFAVRGGYRFGGLASYNYGRDELEELSGSAYFNAFSLGAGVIIPTDWHYVPEVRLDYGVEFRIVGHDDWQHVVTLSIPFDVCPPAGA